MELAVGKILSVARTVRNNWKKTVFGCAVVTYGGQYAKSKYDCRLLMTQYCNEALKCGNNSHSEGSKFRNVIVFLNPAANKRKAKKEFDKYCAPLLYLAGIAVTLVQTKSQGDARSLAEELDESVDAVIVAGGDGLLSETITGILRRETGTNPLSKRVPVGILPLGQINTAAKALLSEYGTDRVKSMAEATMAIIHEVKKPVDVMRIEQLDKETEDQRPLYSVSGLRWGAVHDAYAKRDKYWYWGTFRAYMAYIFFGLKKDGKGITWNCNANLQYSLPCGGCSDCYLPEESMKQKTPSRWWQNFVPKQRSFGIPKTDYSKIRNEECSKVHDLEISSVDLCLETSKEQENGHELELPHLKVSIGPSSVGYFDFIARGWEYIKGSSVESFNTLFVKDMRLQPNITQNTQDSEYWYYIDNDDYEVKPIYVKLLPKRMLMFCQPQMADLV